MDPAAIRTGSGYDIHQLKDGLPLRLGGIDIPHTKGCIAHSDGDVLLHALIDAILGACGKGDIGLHFPDTDPAFANADSRALLQQTLEVIQPIRILNIDINVFCENPRLSPYRESIISAIAELLQISSDCINIKNKTMEGLGPVGTEQAIASAVSLLLIKGT